MEVVQTIFTMGLIFGGIIFLTIIDKKYQLGLNDNSTDAWFGVGSSDNMKKQLKQKDVEIAELSERVRVLERIVTDPREQLKKEIDAL